MSSKPKLKKDSVRENILFKLLENYHGIPTGWRTVYHEGIRGNHLLFSDHELEKFDRAPKVVQSSTDRHVVSKVFAKMLVESSFTKLRASLDILSDNQKLIVYRLYARKLKQWNIEYRHSLN
jgi:hypothetical protein